MTKRYKAVLFSPDGEDWVTDFSGCKSVEEVWDKVNDMGSRWIFYPIVFVIRDSVITSERRRIVDTCDLFNKNICGKTIKTVGRILAHWYQSKPTYWVN